MNVLFAAAEVLPFCKTGGLADVAGSLPHALKSCGVDARVILPRYANIDSTGFHIETVAALSIPFDGIVQNATLQRAVSNQDSNQDSKLKTQNYFIDAPQYFHRPQLYGEADDVLRFGFFCRAIIEALPLLSARENWRPDILHAHDWHAGLLPLFASTLLKASKIKTVFTIHNLPYQGVADKSFLPRLDLDWSLFNYHQLEFYDRINPLKAGVVFSDAVTTVSPTYAREIQTKEFGAGLEGVLAEHAHRLRGILNGLDYAEWNPATDGYISANFDARNLGNKAICKRDLQRAVGLPQSESTPLLGMVSRLSSQKGFDLITACLDAILDLGCQFIVLGAGDEYYMRLCEKLARRHAGRAAFGLGGRNEKLAHQIYAGSDFFLMPSLYEPCGLSQMISLAYGTIPIARTVGGLTDTVHQFDPQTGKGNGFIFRSFNTAAMLQAIEEALRCFNSPAWPRLLQNAFACDFSWGESAKKYAALYEEVARPS